MPLRGSAVQDELIKSDMFVAKLPLSWLWATVGDLTNEKP
jgi:hypothetical protein